MESENRPKDARFENTLPITSENSLLVHTYELMQHDVPHFHRSTEIGICLAGSGKSEVCGKEARFKAGDISIVFPFQVHRNMADPGENCVWKWFFADVCEIANITGCSASLLSGLIGSIRLYGILDTAAFPACKDCVQSLIETVEKKGPYCFEKIYALLTLLFSYLSERSADSPLPPAELPGGFEAISDMMNYVNGKISEGKQPSAPELSAAGKVSPSTCTRLFDSFLHMSPKKYITGCAVRAAQGYLAATGYSIAEIAEMTGFSEISTFNRAFKKVVGTSPGTYRSRFSFLPKD